MTNVFKFQLKPKIEEVTTGAGSTINQKLFDAGYEHGWVSNELIDVRFSFRMGFRKAKIEIREWYKRKGIYHLCVPQKFSIS